MLKEVFFGDLWSVPNGMNIGHGHYLSPNPNMNANNSSPLIQPMALLISWINWNIQKQDGKCTENTLPHQRDTQKKMNWWFFARKHILRQTPATQRSTILQQHCHQYSQISCSVQSWINCVTAHTKKTWIYRLQRPNILYSDTSISMPTKYT